MSMSIRIPNWMIRVSNWIDDTLFPVDEVPAPVVSDRAVIQKRIEADAGKIRKCIETSRTLGHTDIAVHMVFRFIRKHRHSGQNNMLKASVGSLMLELENKKRELLSKL